MVMRPPAQEEKEEEEEEVLLCHSKLVRRNTRLSFSTASLLLCVRNSPVQ